MIRYIRQRIAIRRLNKLVAASKRAPATVEYRRRREAAKLGILRRQIRQELARSA